MKNLVRLAVVFILFAGVARADEGMWVLNNLPRDLLKKKYDFDLTDAWRDRAMKALLEIGPQAEGVVQDSLKGNITPEHRERLRQLQAKIQVDIIRQLRAISTLEQIRTPEAIDVLNEISKAAGQSQIGEAARGALRCLGGTP